MLSSTISWDSPQRLSVEGEDWEQSYLNL